MNLENNNDLKFRTVLLWLLIAAPFLGPYLYFMSIDIVIMTIDVFRMVLIACTLICAVKIIQKKWRLEIHKGSTALLALFLVLTLAIAAVNIARQGMIAGESAEMMALMSVLLYLFCVSTLLNGDIKLWEKLQDMLLVIGGVVIVLAYAEVLFGFYLPSCRYNNLEYLPGYSAHPATSIYANENNLAAFFLIICTVIILRILKETNKKKYILMYTEFAAILILLTLSDSTIYKLGVIIEIILALILFTKVQGRNKALYIKCGVITGLIAGLLVVLKTFFRKGLMLGNILINHGWNEMMSVDISEKLAQGDALLAQLSNTGMGTVTIRKNLFLYGTDAAMDKPVLGHGADSFSTVIGSNEAWLAGTGEIVDPHNFLVELSVQYGILLVIIFITICAIVLFYALKGAWRGVAALKTANVDIVMMLVAFAITTVMPSSFMKYTVYFITMVIVVTGIDIVRKIEKHKEQM